MKSHLKPCLLETYPEGVVLTIYYRCMFESSVPKDLCEDEDGRDQDGRRNDGRVE